METKLTRSELFTLRDALVHAQKHGDTLERRESYRRLDEKIRTMLQEGYGQ